MGGKGQEVTAGSLGCRPAVHGVRTQGEYGRQKPRGSLSRASGWQDTTAAKGEAEEEEGSRTQWHFLGSPLSEKPPVPTFRLHLPTQEGCSGAKSEGPAGVLWTLAAQAEGDWVQLSQCLWQ